MSPRTLLAALLSILTIGWLAVWSSAGWENQGSRQLAHIAAGLVLLGVSARLRPAHLRLFAWPFFLGSAAALALVLLPGIGQTVNGSQRWLSLGPLGSWQPSEFAKLALIFVLGWVYQGRDGKRVGLRAFGLAGLCTGILFALIAKQPDLGTAIVLGAIFFGMSWTAGAPALPMFGLVGAGLAVAPFVLHEYQKNRLLIFLHPETDPRGLGYHITQAQLAIGSGGWVGQGLKQGPLSQNGFVPENWTDFVFSVIGEEFGLLGSWGLLLLGSILAWQLLAITWQCKDRYDALVCSGVCTLLGFQSLVNLSMNVGMAPVVGIPLPFCTYGGSAMLVNLAAVGLVLGSGIADRSAPKLKELLDRTAPQ